MVTIPDGCGNACGLVAAFIGVLGFGSFGAPLKSEAANSVNPDSFVLQTYKSTMCFLTSFIVLALGVEYKFSAYGLLSGLLWVTGGMGGIFGIRNSGLAISVGLWSSITVLVSFAWGILVFGETVVSVWITICGVCMMILGFIGMSYFSSPVMMVEDQQSDDYELVQQEQQEHGSSLMLEESHQSQNGILEDGNVTSLKEPLLQEFVRDEEHHCVENAEQGSKSEGVSSGYTSPSTDDEYESDQTIQNDTNNAIDDNTVLFLGRKWNRRRLGLLGAVTDGIFGGMMLVPMHFSEYHGEEYIISFGTGAMIITLIFWVLRFAYNALKAKSMKKGWDNLPSMHIKTLIIPGGLAGLVWSIGNIGLIFSVSYLGESIGMSIVQSNMIVSGMIGIIWFEEIKGLKAITLWSLSALLTFVGIIFLSSQHKK